MQKWNPVHWEIADLVGIFYTHNADCLMRQQIDFEFADESMIFGGTDETGNQISIREMSPLNF